MELLALSIVFLCFYFVFWDREKQKRFIREQQERRDQQILEWDFQLQQNPWLRDVFEGRITQEDIDRAKKRHPAEDSVEWSKDGF